MKKIVKVLIFVIIASIVMPVQAANYNIKELIPMSTKTSIHSNNLSYKELFFDETGVYFKGIKNISDKELPISISIGLFDNKGKNVGTINYCDSMLAPKEEKPFEIAFSNNYLGKAYSATDIKYIAILGDNKSCKTKGSEDYLGETVEQLGIAKNTTVNDQTELVIKIFAILGGALFLLFLYSFLFTRKFQNFNGSDIRGAYKRVNQDLAKEREEELKRNPPVEKVFKPDKTDEVLQQEEAAKNETGNDTDLHNMYK